MSGPILTASRDGVYPKYQAVGDEGDIPLPFSRLLSRVFVYGRYMLPSEPLRRGYDGIPYPASLTEVSSASNSPKRSRRFGLSDGFLSPTEFSEALVVARRSQ